MILFSTWKLTFCKIMYIIIIFILLRLSVNLYTSLVTVKVLARKALWLTSNFLKRKKQILRYHYFSHRNIAGFKKQLTTPIARNEHSACGIGRLFINSFVQGKTEYQHMTLLSLDKIATLCTFLVCLA